MVWLQIKRARRVLAYYLLGLLASVAIYLITGWQTKVMLPKSMLVFMITLVAALPWTFLNAIGLACPVKGLQNRSEFFIHCIVFAISAFIFFKIRSFM